MAAVEEGVNPSLYTQDGTVDLKGKPVLRSKRGGWTACSFIIVYEIFERMAFYGIGSNLVIYLTTKLHQGTVSSSNNVTNWIGVSFMSPIFGAYIADAYLGRYWTFFVASIIYLLGMAVLTLAVSVRPLKPDECHETNVEKCKATTLQLAVFFSALYTLALGTGGTKPNISTIGADQFDDFDPKEKTHKLSFFNWWVFSIFTGSLFANTILVYIQDNVGWTLGYGLPTLGLLISIIIFLAGTPYYRHKLPAGSPFSKMAKVLVATIRNRKVKVPSDRKKLYELELEEYTSKRKFKIESTPGIRCLNKAAVRINSNSAWKLCTVTQVEETKQILRLLPIWIATFIPSVMLAQTKTLFVKQGTSLDRTLGTFKIPPASLMGFVTISMLISVVIYDRFVIRIMKKYTNNPRGVTLLQRMGIGIVIHIIVMTCAALTDAYRLHVAKKSGVVENGKEIPLTILILLPQFILMGIADAVLEVAKIEFFYDQAPEGMKSLGTSFALTTNGIGGFLSSFLLKSVSKVTSMNGRKGWILNNLNDSHIDYYYAFLAILSFLNFLFFLLMSKLYVYRAEITDSSRQPTEGREEPTT